MYKAVTNFIVLVLVLTGVGGMVSLTYLDSPVGIPIAILSWIAAGIFSQLLDA